MASVRGQLDSIAAQPQTAREVLYLALADQVVQGLPATRDAVLEIVAEMVQDWMPLVLARSVLNTLADGLRRLASDRTNYNVTEDLVTHILPIFQNRAMSFEEQISALRIILADVYEDQERWRDAATTLIAVPLESGHRQVEPDFRLHIYLRISALLLEDDDSVQAEIYVTRASELALMTKNAELSLKFKAQKARIDDAKRNFIDAAQRYIELAYCIPDEEARMMSLSQALNCAVLAPAGQRRSRLLASLYKDERTRTLSTFSMLEAMYLGLMVKKEDLAHFSKNLMPHHMAVTADGSTILEKAIVQHNILSATKIYKNIHLGELGALLQVSSEEAEQAVANMISEGRLEGTIDQIAGTVKFDDATNATKHWDAFIKDVCIEVNRTLEQIGEEQPQWLEHNAVNLL